MWQLGPIFPKNYHFYFLHLPSRQVFAPKKSNAQFLILYHIIQISNTPFRFITVVLFLRKTRKKTAQKTTSSFCRFFCETRRLLWVLWNNWDRQFLDSEGFKYPEPLVLGFRRFQIPRTVGSLIPKVSNAWNPWFFNSQGFKYPELMVVWFLRFQIPGADGSLILKVSNTRGWWFFDSESFKYPGLMVLWFWKF